MRTPYFRASRASGLGRDVVVVGVAANRVMAQTRPPHIIVESPTLRAGQLAPREHTADGRNISPALTWRNLPAATKQIIVTCEDQDEVVPPPFQPPFLH